MSVRRHWYGEEELRDVRRGALIRGERRDANPHELYGRDASGVYRLVTRSVHWTDRGDGGHECNAKCVSATGPACECKCRGANHGR